MKKKFFGALVVVAIAVGAMINVNLNKSNNHAGNLALANVEALADCEITRGGTTILSCSGSGSCSTKYMGYTLTCDGTKH
jgi:hypothetical protein